MDNVYLTIDADMVRPGHWDVDNESRYAVAFDDDGPDARKGSVVWHRSMDAGAFGRMYGWHRVARIA